MQTAASQHKSIPLDIEEVRALLAQKLASGNHQEVLDLVIHLLCDLRDKNDALQQRLHKTLNQLYSRKSEKLSQAELQLVLRGIMTEQPGTNEQPPSASETPAQPPAQPEPPKPPAPKPRTPHGRRPLPAHLPRHRIVCKPAPKDCFCTQCNKDKSCIGSDCSEVLDYRPGGFVVLVFERQKFACKPCDEHGVVIAPVAAKVIEGGLPGPGLLADVVVRKYKDHCPLYRMSRIYGRHGVDLAPSTLGQWVEAAAALVLPLTQRIEEQVLASFVLSTDDTGLRVLDRDSPRGTKRGHIWSFVGDERLVCFLYTPDWKGAHIQDFLKERKGYIQGDAYAGYQALFRVKNPPIKVGCWAHARRKFVEALRAGDARAAFPLQLIQQLYAIEAKAAERGIQGTQEHTLLRQQLSQPILDELHRWLLGEGGRAVPKSLLGKAVTYALNRWSTLLVFLQDARIPLDNNHVEREFRAVACGRKNWLFAGSDEGARRAATLYTVLGSAALAGIKDPWDYLRDVLERLSQGWPMSRLAELLPAAWAKQQRQHLEAAQAPLSPAPG